MELPPFLSRVIGWLRAGYPEGVPEHDYIPLFALLGKHLTDDEVKLVAADLELSSDPTSADAINKAINAVAGHPAVYESDIDRVRSHLAAGGWPLSDPPRES
jgi:Protein of unknown function (DUF3349)